MRGIGVAVGPLQAHDQAPAFAGMDEIGIGSGGAVPGQDDFRRDGGAAGFGVRDVEVEAHAAIETMRQAGDGAGDGDVAAFVLMWQCIVQGQVGGQTCPGEPEKCARADDGRRAGSPSARQHRDKCAREQVRRRGQRRLQLHPGRTGCKREDGQAHG